MKPLVEGLQQEYESKVEFRLLNVERDPEGVELARSLGVQFPPTFVFVNSDGVIAGRLIGEVAESELRERLDALR
jgi:thioredoxin-like negative regulator of GroEL